MAQLDERQQSTSSRALLIPEIIGSIIDRCNCVPTLRACALVSRSWEREARRRLWECCGVYTSPKIAPLLSDLVAIEPDRRQQFAMHIKCLHISDLDLEELEEFPENTHWQGQYLTQLANIKFPCLERIEIKGPQGDGIEEYQKPKLDHLVGPKLRNIDINGWWTSLDYVISNEWIVSLAEKSKGLKEFSFLPNEDLELMISPSVLVSFFKNLRSLTYLRWLADDGLSAAAIDAIAQMPLLKSLHLGKVQDEWVSNLHTFRPEDCFRSLFHLDCRMSAETVTQLLPLLPQLRNLLLRVKETTGQWDSTRRAVEAIADFTPISLECLGVVPASNATINSADILKIAKTAPKLCLLQMPMDYNEGCYVPHLLGLDDDFMESLSPFLSKIQGLHLRSRETKTSERSLIALGRYCPDLEDCTLTANLNFEELLRLKGQTSTEWPNLEFLHVFNYDIQNQGDESNENDENMELVIACGRIADAMPCLQRVSFQSRMMGYCMNGYLGYDMESEGYEGTDDDEEDDDDDDEDEEDEEEDDDWYEDEDDEMENEDNSESEGA